MAKTLSAAALPALMLLAACSGEPAQPDAPAEHADSDHADDGVITLTDAQIAAAGITIAPAEIGGAGSIELPATIAADPQGLHVVSAAIGGRVAVLNGNLGEAVKRGDTLAIIESREAAQIKGDVEAARARLALAQSNLTREQRLYAERVSPEQDLIAARTAATEARIAYDQARAQAAATGAGGGALNRIGVVAPITGQVIARTAALGQTVAADAELFRVANLSSLSLTFNLSPADAGRIRPGNSVTVSAPGRQATARISFVSPALAPQTRLVPAIARLDNRAGQWRVGEAVTAAIALSGDSGANDRAVRVPAAAIQTVAGKLTVFVRTKTGFTARPVTLGDAAGSQVIVQSGLTGGERVAAAGSFTLKAELGKGEAEHGGH